MASWIDGSLYPDVTQPEGIETVGQKVDFIARLCGAWDFGILPLEETAREVHREEWREAVNACLLLTSPAYHLLRRWHGLPELPYLGGGIPHVRDDPNLRYI